jgi:hypothetical protein
VPKLTVDIEARFASFQDSLNKIETAASGTANRIQGAFLKLNTALATLGVGIGVNAFASFISAGVEAQASLEDLSAKTTLTVEFLSQLRDVARLTGADLETVASGANRLAKSVGDARSGNEQLVAAFQAIGISVEDLRSKRFDELFVQFANGVSNATDEQKALAIASQLAGKSVGDSIQFYRDVAQEGLRVASTTREQAEAAGKLQDEFRRLTREITDFQNEITKFAVPALLNLIDKFKILREFSFREAFSLGLQGVNIENVGDRIAEIDSRLQQLRQTLSRSEFRQGGSSGIAALGGALGGFSASRAQEEIRLLEERRAVLERLVRTRDAVAAQSAGGSSSGRVPLAIGDVPRESTKPRGVTPEDLAAAAALKRISEEERREAEFQLAADKEAAEASAILLRGEIQRAEIQQRLTELADDEYKRKKEAASLILDQIDSTRVYARELEKIAQLEEEGLLTQEQAIAATRRAAEEFKKLSEESEGTNDIARDLGLTFSSAFEDAIVKGKEFRDVLKGIAEDIARIIIRESITKPAGEAISKAVKGFDFGSIFGSIFGGGKASGGPVSGSRAYLVGEQGPELFVPESNGSIVPNQALKASGQTVVNNFNIMANDARSFAQMLATPEGRRTIMGVVEGSYNRVGRRSGAGAA